MAITALKIGPGQHPCAVRLRTTQHDLEYAVSAGARYLCSPALMQVEPGIAVLYNSEGALLGLPGNRKIGRRIIAGVLYVVGINERGNLTSLSHADMDRYWTELYEPQEFTEQEVQENYFGSFLHDLDSNY